MDIPSERSAWGQAGDAGWLPQLTTFPPAPPLAPVYGLPEAWTSTGVSSDPEPAEPVLTPLEVVIDSPTFGRMQLGYSPGVDLSQPVALKIDHPCLGVMTLGWIMPAGYPDPYAPTTGVRYEETPFQPPAHWKSGPISDDEADAVGGSDDGAEIQPASWAGGAPKDALGDSRAGTGNGSDTIGTDAYDLAMSRRQADAVAAARAVIAGQGIPSATPRPTVAPAEAGAHDVPPPIDVASLPPGPLGPADYERAVIRNRYLAGLYDPESLADRALNLVTHAMDDPANVLTPNERAEHLALDAKFRETIFPTPTPQEARLDAMLASPIGTAASVAVGALGGSQQLQGAALAIGGALEAGGIALGGGVREPTEFLNTQRGRDLPAKPPEETEVILLPPRSPPDPPPTAQQQVNALTGHGNVSHGPQTTLQEQETRLRTGRAPDGRFSQTRRATRFDSNEAQLDAVDRATRQVEARDVAGLISHDLRVDSNGKIRLPRQTLVVTGFPGGYGSGVELDRQSNISPTGQDMNALVVLRRDPLTGNWNPVTQYPTNQAVTK